MHSVQQVSHDVADRSQGRKCVLCPKRKSAVLMLFCVHRSSIWSRFANKVRQDSCISVDTLSGPCFAFTACCELCMPYLLAYSAGCYAAIAAPLCTTSFKAYLAASSPLLCWRAISRSVSPRWVTPSLRAQWPVLPNKQVRYLADYYFTNI